AALRLLETARWRQPGASAWCWSSALAVRGLIVIPSSTRYRCRKLYSRRMRIQVPARSAMRIGLMIGPERGRYRQKAQLLVADADAAEKAGFASIWVPQVPGDFDAFTAVTLVGRATARIEIGTAVVPIQTRHPIAMAQEALSNQAVCEGRFTLGL